MRLPVLWIPFQIHRFIKGYTVIFRFISVPFHFKVDSFILNHLITSSMEYIALCASFFLRYVEIPVPLLYPKKKVIY